MIKLTTAAIERLKGGMLAVPVSEDTNIHDRSILNKLTSKALKLEEFSGKTKQNVILYSPPHINIERCQLFGIGSKKKTNTEVLRAFAGRAVQSAISAKQEKIIIAVPIGQKVDLETSDIVYSIAEGSYLANHIFDKYKEKSEKTPLKEIILAVSSKNTKAYRTLIERAETICRGTLQAREWISTPSNDKIPEKFARMVTDSAKNSGLKTNVAGIAELKKKKFGALIAVSVGSMNGPKLVEMVYTPKSAKKTIVLVGKGVTFDSGGINLKPSSGLNTMKIDMAGAAVVAATMLALPRLKTRHRVIGLLPLVENMPSGTAIRPGDIVNSFSGKTVEIGNTDAEGRLILIDAMAYAIKKYKPNTLIDIATLTGACMVALGDKLAGVFSPDKVLSEAIIASGSTTHERCWPMPMPEDYKELMKSDLADICNMSSSRYGGAITAALFLSEFVKDTRWAHIDIAGPVYNKRGTDYCTSGGTGFGVRLLCDLIQKLTFDELVKSSPDNF